LLQKIEWKKLAYGTLVESYRTECGLRQRVVAYLGQVGDEEILLPQAVGLQRAAEGKGKPEFVQTKLFDDDELEPQWIEINANAVISWTKRDSWNDWASLSEGCYLLRTNVTDWSP